MPEFDAVLCGYDPRARDRFVSSADNEVLWHRANGYLLAPVLVDGRVGGYWRLQGTGRTKALDVSLFRGARRPRKAELDAPAASLSDALDITAQLGHPDPPLTKEARMPTPDPAAAREVGLVRR